MFLGRTFPFPIYTDLWHSDGRHDHRVSSPNCQTAGWGAALLILLSVFKAALVVWYYMHCE
ncbi:MAG: hypothetical protein IPK19_41880 [Chloroflexi bacterium]|nr:hypothetical protein [Chloroflexota bacterium]